MEKYKLERVAKFLSSVQPVPDDGLLETRKGFKLNGKVFFLTSDFPNYSESDIREWLKLMSIKVEEFTVEVKLNGYYQNGYHSQP